MFQVHVISRPSHWGLVVAVRKLGGVGGGSSVDRWSSEDQRQSGGLINRRKVAARRVPAFSAKRCLLHREFGETL